MRRLLLFIGPLFLLLGQAVVAHATCCAGQINPLTCGTTRAVPTLVYPTIQSAIDASGDPNGVDIVLVYPGTYYENIDYKGKDICVISTESTDPATQAIAAANTIIDGRFRGPVVTSSSPTGFGGILSFFTIQHGGSVVPYASPASRGGVYNPYGTPDDITGNIIKNNNYGGIVVAYTPGGGVSDGQATITGNTITDNTCWGVLAVGAQVYANNNELTGTTAAAGPCNYRDPTVGTTLTTNVSGVAVEGSGIPSIHPRIYLGRNTIHDNAGASGSGVGFGGAGVLIFGGDAYLDFNKIWNNSSPQATGGGVDVEASTLLEMSNNLIYNNRASCGGAAVALNFPHLQVPAIQANQSKTVLTTGYAAVLANNTIADNTVTADPSCAAGSQVIFTPSGVASPSVLFINNVIGSSTADPLMSCGKQPTASLANQAVFDHNLLYNAGQAFFGSDCVDEVMNPQLSNILADPQFINPTSGPYQLTAPYNGNAGSPGIDAGNNAVLKLGGLDYFQDSSNNYLPGNDVAGNPRLQNVTGKLDANGNGLDTIDIGAYESSGQINLADDLSMNVYPGTFPASVGPATLSAYIVQNFTATSPDQYGHQYSYAGSPNSGTISFFIDGKQDGAAKTLGSVNLTGSLSPEGVAVSDPYCFTPGVHVITANYQQKPGSTVTQAQAAVISLAPTPAGIYLSATPVAILEGAAVTFSVTAAPFTCSTYIPSPLSLIDVNTNAVLGSITPDPATGTGSFTTTALHQGYNLIEASFAGNANYVASVSNTVLIDVQATTMLSVSSSQSTVYAYTPFTLTGQITPDPSSAQAESLAFTATPSGSNIEQALGAATLMPGPAGPGNATTGVAAVTASLGAGVYNIAANYAGDKNFAAGRSPSIVETVLANPTSITLRSGLNPAVAFQPIPLTAHVTSTTANVASGSITGTVSFLANGVPVGTGMVDANGNASATVALAAGKYGLVASYAGNDSFAPSQSPTLAETVTADSSATTLAVTPNPGYAPGGQETLTALVTAAASATLPTGTVTFQDNFNGTTVTAGSAVVSPTGQATLTTATLAVGIHRLTANYGGSNDFQPSLSSPVTLTILQRDFTLTTPPSITIQTMHHALLPVSLVSLGDFTDNIALSCANLPAYASCNFPQGASVNLGAGVTATTTIDLDTDALLNFANNRGPTVRNRWLPFAALLLPAGWFTLRRRRSATNPTLRRLAALLALALPALLITACSGKQPGHTTPGTYSITLTGTGQTTNQTHTATFNLVVTP